MNALIDVVSVLTQQILFHFSVNASEANFATANLYESMSKLVSILNYKTIGKQTSMLPVRFTIDVKEFKSNPKNSGAKQLTIPRFTRVSYNSDYFLKNEIVIPLDEKTSDTLYIDSIMFEGAIQEAGDLTALGDEFETFLVEDRKIKIGSSFISDNFFIVYVDEDNTTLGPTHVKGQFDVGAISRLRFIEYNDTSTLDINQKDSGVDITLIKG